jgi:transcriptional regulator PpsR
VKAFKAPKQSLGNLSAETAAQVIETATDIALVLDGDGVIQDVAFQQTDFSLELGGYGKLFGRSWSETVTAESKPKVAALLDDAAKKRKSVWRQLNHQSARGVDVPVLYSAVRLERADRILALGRDLRAVAELQRKLVEAQMSMERDYARLRQVEARYRVLFQLSSEPALIVDASNQKVIEANTAAVNLFDGNPKRIIGRAFPEGFDPESAERLRAMLSALRSGARAADTSARLKNGDRRVMVNASLFRQDVSSMFLIRVAPEPDRPARSLPPPGTKLLKLAECAPDGLVVTDRDGRILSANAAFAEMAQLTGQENARGEALQRWLGRPGVDLSILIANLREHESVRMFATILRGEYGATTDVEVSAVPIEEDTSTSFGFAIRDVGRRLSPSSRSARELPRSADQLTDLIGRVPLKDLVRETTDVIERLCIEAALNLTGNNRASAAEMLGVSRQSLYVKLRRFGLADDQEDSGNPEQ